MSSKIIIIATIALVLLGTSLLFIIESFNHDYDYRKNWSVVYFNDPNYESIRGQDDPWKLKFTIENHQGEKAEYSYKVFVNDEQVTDGKAEIKKGEKKIISPRVNFKDVLSAFEKNDQPIKITIEVDTEDREYEIYKYISLVAKQ